MGLNWANGFSQAGAAAAQLGMEGVKAALEQDKIRLADELAGKREAIGRKETFDYGQQAADAASSRALKDYQAQTPLVVEREGLLNKGRVQTAKDEAQARLDVANDPANVDRQIATLQRLAPVEAKLKADADIQAVLAKVGTPGYIDALHRIAQASQVLTPGQVAEGQLNQLRLSQARTLESMRTAYVSAVNAGNTEEANGIVKAISAYTYDPAKVKDNAELKAAQAVLTSMDATAEDKANAIKFIQRQMADVDAKTGMAGSAPAGAPATPKTREEAAKLPDGTQFIDPVTKTLRVVQRPAGASTEKAASSTGSTSPQPLLAQTTAPDSPAGVLQRRNADIRQRDTESRQSVQASFDADLSRMSAQELFDTYDSLVGRLTPAQLVKYQKAIRAVR